MASNLAWEIVEGLTTEVGPRLAGTEADHRAVEWAKQKLESLSFDKVWLERIEFPVWTRHHESARIVSPFPQHLHITALGYSGSTDDEITAEVVGFVSLEALKEASLEQIKDRIVFINYFTERTRTGEGYSNSVNVRYEAGLLASEKGAAAVLIRSIGTDSHRFPHTGVSTLSKAPLPAAALSAPDADQLARIMERTETVRISLDIKVDYQETGYGFWLELILPTSPGPGMDILEEQGDGAIVEINFEAVLNDMKARSIPMFNMDGSSLGEDGSRRAGM